MRGWLLAGLVVAACSPSVQQASDAPPAQPDAPNGPDPDDGARSGTRLKLTWYQFSDGTRQWDGFYDAQRKETCYIYDHWLNGKAYCTPDYDGSIEYSNSGCTTKVIEVYKDPICPSPPSPYALEWNYTPCESQPAHLYTRGNKLALTQYWYKGSDGVCNGPYTTSTSYDYYTLGAEVKTSDLVEVTLGAPATTTGRLSVRYWQTADGMRRQGATHDSAFGDVCYPGANGCAPNARYVSYEEDSTCTTPKLSISKQCAVPKFAVYYQNNACASDPPSYFTVGAATAGAPLYYYNGLTCTTSTPATTNNYYKMGSAITLSPVTREVGTAGQRIQLVHYTNTDGLDYRSYELFDSQKGAACYPTKLPDGTSRCVVYGGYVDTFYKDTMCTQPIDLVEVSSGGASCAAPTPPKYARKYITPAPGSCDYNTAVYVVGAPYTSTVYEMNGTCVAHSVPGSKLYALGAQVPLTDFITASITTDP